MVEYKRSTINVFEVEGSLLLLKKTAKIAKKFKDWKIEFKVKFCSFSRVKHSIERNIATLGNI